MGLIGRLTAQQIPFEALVYVNTDGKQIAKLDAALLSNVTGGIIHGTDARDARRSIV